jgi:antitoxin component YwqK of YwqJK toxin-antitoxin module
MAYPFSRKWLIIAGLGGALASGLFTACSGAKQDALLEVVETTDEYGYKERIQRRKDNKMRQGLYAKISPEGRLVEEAYYEADSLEGLRIIYYASGDTQIVETYRRGVFSGPYREYHENGKLLQEGKYVNNTMEGVWKTYYPDGQLAEEVTFRDNDENGPFRQYYPNGKLQTEGTFKDGDFEHGELKLYDESGAHIRTMDCDSGKCRTTWQAEGASADDGGGN